MPIVSCVNCQYYNQFNYTCQLGPSPCNYVPKKLSRKITDISPESAVVVVEVETPFQDLCNRIKNKYKKE